MSWNDCPHCGGEGHLATKILLDLFRCRTCHREYFAQHPLCQHGTCREWTDGGTDYCWYHAAHHGIHPPEREKDPTLCHATGCTRPITDDGAGLCDYHAWDECHRREEE